MTPADRVHHRIWSIAWPAILSNISIPLLGLVDTAILGHLEDTRYLGAVAIGGGLLRVAVGAHWLSDVVTAWLLTGLIARLVWLALGMRDAAPPRRALLRADLAALGRRIVPGKW